MITWKGFATAPLYFLCCLLICRHTSHESSWQPRDHGHNKTRHTPLLSIRDTIHNQSYSPWLIDDGFLRTLVRRDPSEFTKCHSRSVWEYPSAVTFHWMSTPRRASTGHTPRMTQVNQHTGLLGATCGGRRGLESCPPATAHTLMRAFHGGLPILLTLSLLKIKHQINKTYHSMNVKMKNTLYRWESSTRANPKVHD